MHPDIPTQDAPAALLGQIEHLRRAALASEQAHAAWIDALPAERRSSARNLMHYLGVRAMDLRPIQRDLAAHGLSSLGLLESHVLASLDAVAARLRDMAGHPLRRQSQPPSDFDNGPALLHDNAAALLGPPREGRDVRIMVTLPSEAADDPQFIAELLRAGMDVARINCAHDDEAVWRRMVQHVRAAAAAQSRECPIQLDLAGPKSRTGALPEQGRVLHLRPQRDARGIPLAPARLAVWFGDGAPPPSNPADDTPLLRAHMDKPGLSSNLPADTSLAFIDSRGRKRNAVLHARQGDLLIFTFDRTAYIDEHTAFRLRGGRRSLRRGTLEGAPVVEGELRLRRGDPLLLTRQPGLGELGERNIAGRFVRPPQLHCTLAAAFDNARAGQAVWLDDGRIGAVITAVDHDRMLLHVSHTAEDGSRLRAEKGINFPDTVFDIPALTDKDRTDLAALVGEVDLVALSFVRQPADVAKLRAALAEHGHPNLGIVLKIENRQAFAHLPAILLEGLQHPRLGIMVARGDLAVELGFERLSEVQEEILWLCEAAHVPVVWATQILDTMARSGLPSRPEVTDAAMSIHAECAMLNKGPYVVDAVRFLSSVLERMEGHYAKRMMLRRPLSIAMLRAPEDGASQPATLHGAY